MLLEASSSFSLLFSPSEASRPSPAAFGGSSASLGSVLRFPRGRGKDRSILAVDAAGADNRPVTGVIFEPFEELKHEISLVPTAPDQSVARQKYADECEAAINEQINVEYNVSYVYHALFAFFDRDNVALKGFAKFFKESSEEERVHAEKLMIYQNKRGGRVKLQSIVTPLTEFDHPEKGDALHAMELALSLEKLTNEKLLNLHSVAVKCNDPQMADFVESEFLGEQVEAIKKISEYVAQLRRVGKGHGVWHFDQMLLHEGDDAA
ncbi:ferritin-3, chloroplastic-like [Phoenix dactylifera]|uniref:Ferritin n=1 Tax=Phoenix dactylifera TaxID=42345 RepID=A0A8B7C5F5_PHODC|nr:ferritin-3, chloroplastic-like [Phoenix dactylifera]